MLGPDTADCARAVRAFNRFYTAHVGALDEHLLDGPFTLTEARILYELGQHSGLSAAVLAGTLRLDPAYLSRILRKFTQKGLLERAPNPRDRRGSVLALTEAGRRAFDELSRSSQECISRVIRPLSAADRTALLHGMSTISGVLGVDQPCSAGPAVIRPHRMGDVSWILYRHASLYRDEFGWNANFEALVAEIIADFLKSHDPAHEHCWVADRGGAILGSVFLVRAEAKVAKLRLLYVESSMRGGGIGRRLVEECISFARQAGYTRMTLWTNDVLTGARRLYDALGFEQVAQTPHCDFGPPMVGQVLERDL